MREKGQGLLEYGLIVLLIVVIAIVVFIMFKVAPVAAIIGGIILGIISASVISFIFIMILSLVRTPRDDSTIPARSRLSITPIVFLISSIAGSILWSIFFLNMTGIVQKNRTVDKIMFAGQVVNSSIGDWNNRLVLVYERNKEVGRDFTHLGEFSENDLGMIDGLFVIEIPNPYQFSLANFEENKVPFDFHLIKRSAGFLKSYSAIFHWFPRFQEGAWEVVSLPSKDLYYVVKVLEGNIKTLPSEILNGKTEFKNGPIFVVEETPVPDNLGVEGEYLIQEIRSNVGTEPNVISNFTVPLNNCGSDQELRNPYSYTQTFVHKYYEEKVITGGIQISLPIATWLKLVAELQAKYGFEDNQINETNLSIEMFAAPHTYQYYVITWTEIWEKGIAYIIKDSQPMEVPFRVKTRVEYKVESKTLPCP
jgi:hypothetical protein